MVGISFRRRDQLKPDVWGVQGKVVQCNARFGLSERLEVNLDHVRTPAGNGKTAEKTKGKSLNVMSATKSSIVKGKVVFLCLSHALIIAMSRVNGDPKYKSNRNGYRMKQPIQDRLSASGVDLINGRGFKELEVSKLSFALETYCV